MDYKKKISKFSDILYGSLEHVKIKQWPARALGGIVPLKTINDVEEEILEKEKVANGSTTISSEDRPIVSGRRIGKDVNRKFYACMKSLKKVGTINCTRVWFCCSVYKIPFHN